MIYSELRGTGEGEEVLVGTFEAGECPQVPVTWKDLGLPSLSCCSVGLRAGRQWKPWEQ